METTQRKVQRALDNAENRLIERAIIAGAIGILFGLIATILDTPLHVTRGLQLATLIEYIVIVGSVFVQYKFEMWKIKKTNVRAEVQWLPLPAV